MKKLLEKKSKYRNFKAWCYLPQQTNQRRYAAGFENSQQTISVTRNVVQRADGVFSYFRIVARIH